MKNAWFGIMLLPILGLGCAEHQLKLSTNSLIPTLRSIQREQVLDNLGRFLKDPDSVPIEVCITGGGVQVANQVQPAFKFPFHGVGAEADLQFQGQLTENWSLSPVCDADDLGRLRALYRCAIGKLPHSFSDEYPKAVKMDQYGNPIAGNPMFDPATKSPPRKFVNNSGAASWIFCGVHEGEEVWIRSESELDEFTMWIFAATPNTTAGGGGAGKGKPAQPLLNPS